MASGTDSQTHPPEIVQLWLERPDLKVGKVGLGVAYSEPGFKSSLPRLSNANVGVGPAPQKLPFIDEKGDFFVSDLIDPE